MFTRLKQLLYVPFHPILWGLYPLTSLYLANIAEVTINVLGLSLIFSLTIAVLVFFLIYISIFLFMILFRQQSHTRIILVTTALVFLYLIVYRLLKNVTFHEAYLFRHRYLIPLWVFTFTLVLIHGMKPYKLINIVKDKRVLELSTASSSVCLILFFSYGHVFNMLSAVGLAGSGTDIHRFLGPLWIVTFLAGLFYLVKIVGANRLTPLLNTISSVLILITGVQIGIWQIRFSSNSQPEPLPASDTVSATTSNSPDIYYIVLDGYGRSDYLFEKFGFDNSAFLTELETLGFVIPNCTQSNYHLTILSITSALNMAYLTDMPPGQGSNSSYLDFKPYLQNSEVLKFFDELGYETFTFSGINPYTVIPNSTHFYDAPEAEVSVPRVEALNFYYLFLQTTAFRPVLDYFEQKPKQETFTSAAFADLIPFDNDLINRHYWRYQQNVYHIRVLEDIPEMPGKKFVYAHLYMAHEPFVFTPEGKFRPDVSTSEDAYIDQILFLNKRIPEIVRKILTESSTPPIIVLQADHSWGWDNDRVRILNAYYLPDNGNRKIYPSISPVNTFRLIANTYFKGTFDLLPDASFTGPYGDFQTRNLSTVPNTCAIP